MYQRFAPAAIIFILLPRGEASERGQRLVRWLLHVPDDFDHPLPDELLKEFEGA